MNNYEGYKKGNKPLEAASFESMEIKVKELIDRYSSEASEDGTADKLGYEAAFDIMGFLRGCQSEFRYVPREAIYGLHREKGIALAKIYGPATFFDEFTLVPKGRYLIKLCNGLACNARGSSPLLEELYRMTGMGEDCDISEDGNFSLEVVPCMGNCGLSPYMTVNGRGYGLMTPEKLRELIEELGGAKTVD